MDENIQYGYRTKDGKVHRINVTGVRNITEAVMEVISSLLRGGLEDDGQSYTADDIVEYVDIPG